MSAKYLENSNYVPLQSYCPAIYIEMPNKTKENLSALNRNAAKIRSREYKFNELKSSYYI